CHDHKYDPFSTKEYYELLAYFNNTEKEADRANPKTPSSIKFQGPSMPLADQQRDSRRSELQEQLADARRRQAKLRQQVEAGLENRIGRLNEQIADAPRTRVLEIHDFQSQGTTDTHEILDDGSVLLVGGDPPDKDEYKMRATIDTDQQGNEQVIKVSALRLDALLDDSLPEQGPGRGERRNFVLNHFGVEFLAADQSRRKLSFAAARASFSQKKWDVFGAVDDQPKTGWAISPQQGKPHWATFELDQPITLGPGDCLEVTMTHSFGRAISIGRFKISAVSGDVHAEPVPEMIVKAAQKPSAQWTNKERDALVDYFIETDSQTIAIKETIRDLEKQIAGVAPDTTLVMVELDQPRPSNVLMSGDYKSPGQPVQPGTPKALHPTPTGPPNRLTLAKWLTSRDNPIVARVTVNRWWAELFGQGIVTTVDDFGIKGEPPSHPELLDWLAMELMDNGWSMKQLLKTIVMSSTYQQSSAIRHDLRDVDPDNRLLARGARFRMDAEMIRDNALAASGLLSLKQFGPPIRPFQPDGVWSKVGGEAYDYEVSPDGQRHRRGIYVVIKRGSPYPSFVNFDATARLACTVKRSRTNTPLQALTLLNDPVFVEAASSLSERIRNERGGEPVDEQIDYGFQICTSRKPNESERATLMHLYRQQSDSPDPMYGVATVLLNLHETITKD
ncbi:MAG: DUF1553 domain-containing protein, partial [Planctomycetales bacterium]|nr:DUF1553 domain-containing protein [Planctomycetales bacterium]